MPTGLTHPMLLEMLKLWCGVGYGVLVWLNQSSSMEHLIPRGIYRVIHEVCNRLSGYILLVKIKKKIHANIISETLYWQVLAGERFRSDFCAFSQTKRECNSLNLRLAVIADQQRSLLSSNLKIIQMEEYWIVKYSALEASERRVQVTGMLNPQRFDAGRESFVRNTIAEEAILNAVHVSPSPVSEGCLC
ncbi:uncharacterized protein LOC142320766 [Lycorma delicatula]|uniref:uncharacterized protein LOC142320766 n=1 Tax=Lycorma delicatula TaxID=130591 RepID=UPI003F514338